MKIVEYNPKETFGLLCRVYPFLGDDADVKGWEFSYSVSDDGYIEIFGRYVSLEDAQKYSDGLQRAINLAKEGQE
jgi:hypothetical protein